LSAAANAFLPGHCLRLEVFSCHFPKYDRNPNTGDPPGQETALLPSRQAVYHQAGYPSQILLPVVEA
jgi:predicted acyl esterase